MGLKAANDKNHLTTGYKIGLNVENRTPIVLVVWKRHEATASDQALSFAMEWKQRYIVESSDGQLFRGLDETGQEAFLYHSTGSQTKLQLQ
jgi:hypothetical protein